MRSTQYRQMCMYNLCVVRAKSKEICELLNDTDMLRKVRADAAKNKVCFSVSVCM